MGYCELHASSAFSFLRGGILPEDLAISAAENSISTIAQLDRDNISGAIRFDTAAKLNGIRPIIGAEVTMFDGTSLPLIPISQKGYANLCRLLTEIKLRSPKNEHRAHFDDLERFSSDLICLSGGHEDGFLSSAVRTGDAPRYAGILKSIYGGKFFIEVQRHLKRDEERVNKILFDIGDGIGIDAIATNGVIYSDPRDREIADAFLCLRHRNDIFHAGRLLSFNAERYMKSPRRMEDLFKDRPDVVARTGDVASMIGFSMDDVGYGFPDYETPDGAPMGEFLRHVTYEGARKRYDGEVPENVRRQLERELTLVENLGLCGYFLLVWDIVAFCRRHDILAQGRGSAANSAVCYCLGITAVDPVTSGLLFERFLSEERQEWPDIDLDLPSGHDRELVIQYLYKKYGERGAAMTANVITYRKRSAIREMGKVFGIPEECIATLSKLSRHFGSSEEEEFLAKIGEETGLAHEKKVMKFAELVCRIQDFPRHLGQHSGGMVVFRGMLDQVVPLEPASMDGRVILQWDKDDCAKVGIIKVDLLGLGMLAAVRDTINLVREHEGIELDMGTLPKDDPLVYQALQKADTVGMFQVESRAQMSSLPRTKPSRFYDIVVQVAIIRPGPIVGQMLGPYVKRRAGEEQVDYLDPILEPILKKTLGVPLFQEQLLRIAMTAADFSGGEAEELRRAFGFKRADKKVAEITERLVTGMEKKGISPEAREKIARAVNSFAIYGFPESHAASFAIITYASAYLKCRHLSAFTVALLNNQPMGFYSPATLIKDAERKGQRFEPIDVQHSDIRCTLERDEKGFIVRMGLMYVRGLSRRTASEIMIARETGGEFKSLSDLLNRVPCIDKREMRALSMSGALRDLDGSGKDRRASLWEAEAEMRPVGPLLKNLKNEKSESPLPLMTQIENIEADFLSTGMTVDVHPMALVRDVLIRRKQHSSEDLRSAEPREIVTVSGAVICRQRPGTAKGVLFISLEDEFGVANIIVMPDVYARFRRQITESSYMSVKGVVEKNGDSALVKGLYFERMSFMTVYAESHDYH